MVSKVLQNDDYPRGVRIPNWVTNLRSFSRWTQSAEFPKAGRFSFISDRIWVDLSPEQPFTHNIVKFWIALALATLARNKELGILFTDRVRFRNNVANLSTEPDGMFAEFASLESHRIALVKGAEGDDRQFAGTPDMVLEVVSNSSETKDRIELRDSYYASGVDEYWLADAREHLPTLDILRRGPSKYETTRHLSGNWVRSEVFGSAFRLIRTTGPDGNPQFTLEHRE